jgi:hypothetical protein
MLVDEYEQYNNDRTDVIVVSRSGSEEEPEPEVLANDCTEHSLLSKFDRVKHLFFAVCDAWLQPTMWPCRRTRSYTFRSWSAS